MYSLRSQIIEVYLHKLDHMTFVCCIMNRVVDPDPVVLVGSGSVFFIWPDPIFKIWSDPNPGCKCTSRFEIPFKMDFSSSIY